MVLFRIISKTLALLIIANTLNAQSSTCEQTLNQASQEFSAGHFYGIPSLLGPCINKLTKEQTIKAYLLLTQVYMVIDDPVAAEESYLKLLKVNPEYIATEDKDPIDLVYLSKKFTTRPIFTPHFSMGLNVSMAQILAEVNADPLATTHKQSIGLGGQLSVGLDWNINDHFSIGSEFRWGSKSFKSSTTGISLRDELQLSESQTWIDIPVYLTYSRIFGRIRPFVYGGFAYNNLSAANEQATFKNINEDGSSAPTEGAVPLLYKRNRNSYSMVFGLGIKYKLGKYYVAVDLRHMKGLNNLAKISTNYYSDDGQSLANSITQYRLIGDLFTLDNYSLSFSFFAPLYYPRKIKNSETKNFIGKMFKKKKKPVKE